MLLTKKAWCLVSRKAHQQLISNGSLTLGKETLEQDKTSFLHIFPNQYNFMKRSMISRNLHPVNTNDFPLWMWTTYNGVAGGKPTIIGETGFLLELSVPVDKILESSFAMWEAALNNANLNKNYLDDSSSTQDEIEQSWCEVFNLLSKNDYTDVSVEDRCIQATIWEIKKEYITSSTEISESLPYPPQIQLNQ
ncbi:DUF3841 domain-containing protein [Photobacterium damselae]|uniref:DUF3841 domain-containing protein n=1 Tax=Photobacterium damselae TaxID=38293 RepID=UPI004067E150